MTLVALDLPLREAVMHVADQAGVGIAVPASEILVTCNFNSVPAEHVFRQLAAQAGMGVTYRNGMISFGSEVDGRDVYAILDPGYVAADEAANLFAMVLGKEGEVKSVNGRVSFSGSREGLARALDVVEGYKLGPDAWRLTVVVYEISAQLQRELGVELALGFVSDLNLGAASGDFAAPLQGARAALSVAALGKLADVGTDARVHTVGTLYLLEGQQASLSQGETVPIPRRVVSPEGTLSTEGYQYVDAGFKVDASGRRVPGGLQLELKPQISAVTGFVAEAPILSQATITGTVIVSSGEWVVLSGLSRQQTRVSGSGLPWIGTTMRRTETGDSTLLVCVRADRVRQAYTGTLGSGGVAGGLQTGQQ